jgi:beta-lactamase regulating signal transducer with metallopeptidase domain
MLPSELLLILTNFAEWLAIASLKTIPLIAFVLIVQRLFRKQLSAAARHLLWLSVLLSLSIPFGWNLHLASFPTSDASVSRLDSTQHSVDSTTTDMLIVSESGLTETHNIGTQDNLALQEKNTFLGNTWAAISQNYSIALTLFWLGGVIVFLSLTLARAHYFHRTKASASPAPSNTFATFQTCKLELGITTSIQLLSTPEIQSPITVGWLRPAVILPHNLDQHLTPATLKHVLLHELGHIKRHDILLNWLACIINILHWFNPAVWFACKRMRMDMEMACDALVLSHLDKSQRKSYGATLIEISEIPRTSPKALTTLGILENHTELKERLNMIKEFTTMNIKNTILFGLILTATAVTSFAQPNTITHNKPSNTVTENSNDKRTDDHLSLKDFAKIAERELKTKVLVGQNDAKNTIQVNVGKESLNYGQFLTQLKINEYTAYKSKDYIQIVPMREARNLSIPIVEKGKTYFEDEVVTDYLKTEKACSGQVLAVVRPLVPQYSHLSAYEDARTLIIIDTYGNIQRIKAVIKALEANLDAPVDCKNARPIENRTMKNDAK